MSNQLYGGSICITDLMEKATSGHSAFIKSKKNGKVYVNILIWHNAETDKYGNDMSLQLSSTKEKQETEPKFYIGNAKRLQTTKPVLPSDIPTGWDANIPTQEPGVSSPPQSPSPATADGTDDLPF